MPFSSKLKFPDAGGGFVVGFGVVGFGVVEFFGFGVVEFFGVGVRVGFGAIVEFGEIVEFIAAVDGFAVEVTILGIAECLDVIADVVWFAGVDARLWTDNIVEFDCFVAVVDLGELVGEGVSDSITPWLSSTR